MLNKKRLQSFSPFISLGIAIVVFVALFILLFNLLFWGVILGSLLWLGVFIKQQLFGTKHSLPTEKNEEASTGKQKKHQGITIDHDDL